MPWGPQQEGTHRGPGEDSEHRDSRLPFEKPKRLASTNISGNFRPILGEHTAPKRQSSDQPDGRYLKKEVGNLGNAEEQVDDRQKFLVSRSPKSIKEKGRFPRGLLRKSSKGPKVTNPDNFYWPMSRLARSPVSRPSSLPSCSPRSLRARCSTPRCGRLPGITSRSAG